MIILHTFGWSATTDDTAVRTTFRSAKKKKLSVVTDDALKEQVSAHQNVYIYFPRHNLHLDALSTTCHTDSTFAALLYTACPSRIDRPLQEILFFAADRSESDFS